MQKDFYEALDRVEVKSDGRLNETQIADLLIDLGLIKHFDKKVLGDFTSLLNNPEPSKT